MLGRTNLSKREPRRAQAPDPHDDRRDQQQVPGADRRMSIETQKRAGGARRVGHRSGPPAYIKSDSPVLSEVEGRSEFIATADQKWLGQVGVKTLYIAPGSPWENG